MNSIHITGRLCADPEIRTSSQSGTTYCRLQVAVNRRFANKQTGEREADFISCIAWGHTSENIFSKETGLKFLANCGTTITPIKTA